MVIFMKYYLIGIKGAGMSGLANILVKDGHIVEGIDVEEDFYTMKSLSNIKIDTFENFAIKEDFIYIIGNAYINHSITNMIKELNLEYEIYPKFIDRYFSKYKMIGLAGSHGRSNSKGRQKYAVKSGYFEFFLFYFSIKIG